MKTVRDLDRNAEAAKTDWHENAIPNILAQYSDVDSEKLEALATDFFDIFCELNQIREAAKSHSPKTPAVFHPRNQLILDTNKQWQYYAAFFYHRLTSDSDLSPSYTPEELEGLELKMKCSRDKTMGLDHDQAVRVIGSLIRAGMNVIREHFYGTTPIFTNNLIPDANRGNPKRLLSNQPIVWPESYPSREEAGEPSTQDHALKL